MQDLLGNDLRILLPVTYFKRLHLLICHLSSCLDDRTEDLPSDLKIGLKVKNVLLLGISNDWLIGPFLKQIKSLIKYSQLRK